MLDRLVTEKMLSDDDTLLHFTARFNRPKVLSILVKIPGIDINA